MVLRENKLTLRLTHSEFALNTILNKFPDEDVHGLCLNSDVLGQLELKSVPRLPHRGDAITL